MPVWAGENPSLENAELLLGKLDYRRAAPALDAAWTTKGNSLEQVLRILELQGVVAGSLKDLPKATRAFQMMLTIDPSRRVLGDQPPRVMTAFYEARGRVAEQGQLKVSPGAQLDGDTVKALRLDLVDSMRLVQKVRFSWRLEPGAAWSTCEARPEGAAWSCAVSGTSVQWWAELTNEHGGVVGVAGSAAAPLVAVRALEPPPVPLSEPPAVVVAPAAEVQTRGSPLRVISFVVAGLGVGAAVAGLAVGFAAEQQRSSLVGATRDDQQRVTSVNQRTWSTIEQEQRLKANVANALFIGAGVLAAAGVVLFLVGSPSEPSVALVPAMSGVALTGAW